MFQGRTRNRPLQKIKIKSLKWDSGILGVRSGLIDCRDLRRADSAGYTAHIKRLISRNPAVKFITLKLPENSLSTVSDLVRQGAEIIDTEFVFRYPKSRRCDSPVIAGHEVKFMKRLGGRGLIGLAGQMKHSRFFLDRNIPKHKAMKLWKASVKNHCEGLADGLAVCLCRNRPCGLAALKIDGKTRKIYLHIVGVLEKFQGRGMGSAMLAAIIDKYSKDYDIFVETQSINKAALRLYQKAGFGLDSVNYILHYWQ